MDIATDAATARPVTVAFVNCFDATTFGRTVHLTADEERRLRNVLAALRDYGFILAASFEPALPGYGFADVAGHLRVTIGSPIADAALAAAERSVPAIDPAPAVVMPVWAFEPDPGNEDVLLSSARLWGATGAAGAVCAYAEPCIAAAAPSTATPANKYLRVLTPAQSGAGGKRSLRRRAVSWEGPPKRRPCSRRRPVRLPAPPSAASHAGRRQHVRRGWRPSRPGLWREG